MTIALVLIEDADSLSKAQMARCRTLIGEPKWQRLQRFLHREDASRSLAGELAARILLAEHQKMSLADISFCIDSFGRPHLEGTQTVDFNISHSGPYAACVVVPGRAGIDIECSTTCDDTVIRRFFSSSECRYLRSLAPSESKAAFCRLWTLKESYLKALGCGLSLLEKARFVMPLTSVPRLCNERENDRYRFAEYALDDYYACSVCYSPAETQPSFPRLLRCEQLLDRYGITGHTQQDWK